ncbi:pyridoxamine 5'-phosphate oxidase family protein [Methylocapsa polymorpha]|uniref:Pyridoxamine 5'-phosphate oxidase family protein n=1 Tax=Methylocapsa polymorpha TaxID=3080828 RepID=A0ABZ0HT79_9HYPH|nr:pyridoxamine 5'-phosphate oxidase family protein [Methylocapsa sp. RX1]
MSTPSSDIAFSPSVKAIQERRGSRSAYAKTELRGGFNVEITPALSAFLSEIDTAYLATASAVGQPYAQHRGGPKGFIKVLDSRTLAFADFAGNRQYVTLGNLAENDRAFLFLMDYENRRRVKVWGRAKVVENDAALINQLTPKGYRARPEQAILIAVEAWDVNCSQHIPRKIDAEEASAAIHQIQKQIAALTAENARLRDPLLVAQKIH